jgi:ABC-type glycerol-3-phosphate transport system substrate-binding protein
MKFTFPRWSIFLLLIFSAFLMIGQAGCRGGGGAGTSNEPITLTFWHLFDSAEVFQPIIDDYKHEHPNITVTVEKKSPQDYEFESLNSLAADKGPDIWSLPNDWLPKHSDKLVTKPGDQNLDDFAKLYAPIVSTDVIIDGKIYGLPLYVDSLGVYFNRDLFTETLTAWRKAHPNDDETGVSQLLKGVPGNWDDFVEAVKLLTVRSGNNIERAGVAMGTSGNTDNANAILSALMLQNGTAMVNANKSQATFNLSAKKQTGETFNPGTEALAFYTAFATPGNAYYSWNGATPLSIDAFINGKAAMIIDFAFVQNVLKQRAPTLNWDTASLPQIKGTTATHAVNYGSYLVVTVTKSAKDSAAAWDFVNFLGSRTSLGTYRSATRRPPPFRDQLEGDVGAFSVGSLAAQTFYKPDAVKVDQIFTDMINEVVGNKLSAQAAIDAAAARYTELLKEAQQ